MHMHSAQIVSVLEGIGWYFNKLFPHTELFGDFISRSIETGKWRTTLSLPTLPLQA